MELLRVGKRLEQRGTGLCVRDLWPLILSFCGRGWFEPQTALTEDNDEMQGLVVGGETGNSILNSLSIRSTLSTDDSIPMLLLRLVSKDVVARREVSRLVLLLLLLLLLLLAV